MVQGCFMGISRVFNGYFSTFQGCLHKFNINVNWMCPVSRFILWIFLGIQGCIDVVFECVLMVLQGCFKVFLGLLERHFERVSKFLKAVLRVFQG